MNELGGVIEELGGVILIRQYFMGVKVAIEGYKGRHRSTFLYKVQVYVLKNQSIKILYIIQCLSEVKKHKYTEIQLITVIKLKKDNTIMNTALELI